MTNVNFHAYSDRLCALHFSMGNYVFRLFSVYFPISWDAEGQMDNLYDVLALVGGNCCQAGAVPIVAGDFNASLGSPLWTDDVETLGFCGVGVRNESGWMLSRWVHQTGLIVQNRMDREQPSAAAWTCQRSMDGMLFQIDFILTAARFRLVKSWCDFALPIGLDHPLHPRTGIPSFQKLEEPT